MRAIPCLLCLALVLLVQPPSRAADVPPDAAALVNGAPIPKKLVDAFLANDREALQIDVNPATETGRANLAKVRRAILDELIDRALIAQAVAARGVAPTAAQLDAAEKDLIDFCGSLPRYERYVAQNGFDRAGYRAVILASAANGKAMQQSLAGELPPPTADEIKAYFEAHRAEAAFQWPERVTALHILIQGRPGVLAAQLQIDRHLSPGPELDQALAEETERRRRLAEDLRAKAAAPGADFEALAREHSEDYGTRPAGGALGTFARGVHPAALDDALFALKPGEVGPVVKTDFGFHVVKVLDHRPAGPYSLEDATPGIRQKLSQAALVRRTREWLRDAREKAVIVLPKGE